MTTPISSLHCVLLGELCRYDNGGTPSKKNDTYWNGAIPWITSAEIQNGFVLPARSTITSAGLENSAAKVVPAGTLLLVTRTGVGKVASACYSLAFSQDITAIYPDTSKLDRDYLRRFLCSKEDYFRRHSRGATIKGITRAALNRLPIPLPPMGEQKRIAGILDAADALRAKRRDALAQLDALLQATFLDMFGDPVTNPKGWDENYVLGEVADVASGITKGRKLNGAKTKEVPYLAVINVQDRHLWLDTVKTIHATEAEIDRYRLEKNDLVLTEGGDRDKLGRGSLWNGELKNCIHQNHVFRVRIASEQLTPIFVNWIIGSSRGKKYFLRSAKQTTGIASINMTQLRAFPMLVPPLDLQNRFAAIVEKVEEQKAHMRAHLAELDTLFASLQSRAFSGEL